MVYISISLIHVYNKENQLCSEDNCLFLLQISPYWYHYIHLHVQIYAGITVQRCFPTNCVYQRFCQFEFFPVTSPSMSSLRQMDKVDKRELIDVDVIDESFKQHSRSIIGLRTTVCARVCVYVRMYMYIYVCAGVCAWACVYLRKENMLQSTEAKSPTGKFYLTSSHLSI